MRGRLTFLLVFLLGAALALPLAFSVTLAMADGWGCLLGVCGLELWIYGGFALWGVICLALALMLWWKAARGRRGG